MRSLEPAVLELRYAVCFPWASNSRMSNTGSRVDAPLPESRQRLLVDRVNSVSTHFLCRARQKVRPSSSSSCLVQSAEKDIQAPSPSPNASQYPSTAHSGSHIPRETPGSPPTWNQTAAASFHQREICCQKVRVRRLGHYTIPSGIASRRGQARRIRKQLMSAWRRRAISLSSVGAERPASPRPVFDRRAQRCSTNSKSSAYFSGLKPRLIGAQFGIKLCPLGVRWRPE